MMRTFFKTGFISISVKLTVPIVLLVALVAVAAYFATARAANSDAMRSKEAAVDMVVKLASFSMVPAVVFGDEVELQRAVGDLARNPEILDVEVWDSNPSAVEPLARFHRTAHDQLGRPESLVSGRSFGEAGSLLAVEPVVSLEGNPVASLSVRFSTSREAATVASLKRQFLFYATAASIGLVAAILLFAGRVIIYPIQRLQRAARGLAQGTDEQLLARRASMRFDDEVVRLTDNFLDMADAVRDREMRLETRSTELKLILDSVNQGFLTALPDGKLLPERSAIVDSWFGEIAPSTTLWELASRLDPAIGEWTEVCWPQLFEDVLPLEVALSQLPERATRGEQHFRFSYHPASLGSAVQRVVVVITDVTLEVERQRVLAEQHEFSALVDFLVHDRQAFQEAWTEAQALVTRSVSTTVEDTSSLRRTLHTLKGGARALGLQRLAETCHGLEDALKERPGDCLSPSECEALQSLWRATASRIEPLMMDASTFLELSRVEYDGLLQAARDDGALNVLRQLRSACEEATASRLTRAREIVEATCRRLGKTKPNVIVESHEVRLPSARWAPLWMVLPHLLNNAADHGLEADTERQALGKPAAGTIKLSTAIEQGDLVLEVSDDGGGIDWERVRARAAQLGLPHSTAEHLEEALFLEGLSLKESVSEISGRGVGLSAVREVVRGLEGEIQIQTRSGEGTTWRICCPLHGGASAGDSRERASVLQARESSPAQA